MRNRKNRIQVDRLAVLGAGASYDASRPLTSRSDIRKCAPLDKDFVDRILNYDGERPIWALDVRERVENGWCFPVEMSSFGLEAAILRQVGHLEFLQAIVPRRARLKPSAIDYLDDISHILSVILSRACENSRKLYKKFSGQWFKPNQSFESPAHRIITFNYDTLLDKYLLKRQNLPARRLYFDQIRTRNGRYEVADRPEQYTDPLLLKLHGSINWRTPTEEFKRILGDRDLSSPQSESGRIDPVWYEKSRSLAAVDDDVSPCIVPPLPNKPITSIRLFKYLWTKASEYLSTAKEIAIIGYSLPTTDAMAVSLFTEFDNPRLERVVVVDPNPAKLRDWQHLFRRNNLRWPRWEYHSTFEDYCDSL